jgi:hypothetical protein
MPRLLDESEKAVFAPFYQHSPTAVRPGDDLDDGVRHRRHYIERPLSDPSEAMLKTIQN